LDEVIRKIVVLHLILLVISISGLIGSSEKILAQSIDVWYGNVDDSPISGNVDDTVEIDVYIQTDPDAYVGDIILCLGTNEQYIDTMLSSAIDDSLVIFYPFSEWAVATFGLTSYSPPNEPGWFCQPFLGFARLGPGNQPWLHNAIPLKALTFVGKTVNDSTLIGLTVEAFGPGQDQFQGPSNAGDTLGFTRYTVVESFSYLTFGGLGAIAGIVTDSTGQPIENVAVEVFDTNISDTTNSQGYYLLSGLIPGTYNLVFSHPDYIDTSISDVSVTGDGTTILDVVLNAQSYGFIGGNVVNVTRNGIEDVEVNVVNTIIADTTDFDGNYLLMNVPLGAQSISFSHPAYRDTVITGIIVTLNDTAFVDTLVFIEGADGPLPDKLGLLVNYPNPFTTSTTIRFYLAAPDQVEVKIYDLLGRKVKSFTAIQGKTGSNLVHWFASDYAAGVYIVKVNSGNASITKSIIKF